MPSQAISPLVPFSSWEVLFYSLASVLPYFGLVIFIFKGKLRLPFHIQLPVSLMALLLDIFINFWAIYADASSPVRPIGEVLLILLYVSFLVLSIRAHPGQMAFAILIFANFENLINVSSKCIEGLIWPTYALWRYHFTYPLIMIVEQIVLLPILYYTVFQGFSDLGDIPRDISENRAVPSRTWSYLWIVPGVFFIAWMYNFYFGSGGMLAVLHSMLPSVESWWNWRLKTR